MSEKITNTFSFYGNQKIRELERDLISDFQQDRIKGNDNSTAIKRILYGLAQDDEFNTYEVIGVHRAWHYDSPTKFELISKQSSLARLQDYITQLSARFDPDVVVQMDYVGNTPSLVGTRFSRVDSDGDIIASEAQQDLDHWFCDEDDVENQIAELRENGLDSANVMSFQDLDQLVIDLRLAAMSDFNFNGCKKSIRPDSTSNGLA